MGLEERSLSAYLPHRFACFSHIQRREWQVKIRVQTWRTYIWSPSFTFIT